jgi:hypothetical protein
MGLVMGFANPSKFGSRMVVGLVGLQDFGPRSSAVRSARRQQGIALLSRVATL